MNVTLTTVYSTNQSRLSPAIEKASSNHRAECLARLNGKKRKKTKPAYKS